MCYTIIVARGTIKRKEGCLMNDEKKEALQTVVLKTIGAKPDEVETIEIRIVYKPSKEAKAEKPKQS